MHAVVGTFLTVIIKQQPGIIALSYGISLCFVGNTLSSTTNETLVSRLQEKLCINNT